MISVLSPPCSTVGLETVHIYKVLFQNPSLIVGSDFLFLLNNILSCIQKISIFFYFTIYMTICSV